MFLLGLILFFVVTMLLGFYIGEAANFILAALAFGMIFSVYMKTRQIVQEIRLIKEKLAVEDDPYSRDFNVSTDEIEKELEQYINKDDEEQKD